jgi:undecaprenol kinase
MRIQWDRFVNSFKYAFMGIVHAYKSEQNIRIHTMIGIVVCFFAFLLNVSEFEWMIIICLIGGMLSLELINTAIERTIDLITDKEYHLLAKQAKDLAAGAVFVYTLVSIIIGLIIFSNRLIAIF